MLDMTDEEKDLIFVAIRDKHYPHGAARLLREFLDIERAMYIFSNKTAICDKLNISLTTYYKALKVLKKDGIIEDYRKHFGEYRFSVKVVKEILFHKRMATEEEEQQEEVKDMESEERVIEETREEIEVISIKEEANNKVIFNIELELPRSAISLLKAIVTGKRNDTQKIIIEFLKNYLNEECSTQQKLDVEQKNTK